MSDSENLPAGSDAKPLTSGEREPFAGSDSAECGETIRGTCRGSTRAKDGYACRDCDERDLLATYHDPKAHPKVREEARMALVAKLIGAF